MTIEEQVNEGIKNAMKAHDKIRLETMRNIKKVILETKTKPGANDQIDDAECLKIIQKLAKQGKESADIYKQQGREDLYEQESGQVAVLEEFLPKQMSDSELTEALKEIIAAVGASSPQDMGKVMGAATKKLAGLADGKAISATVKELLNR
ncbi:MAG: GatB/YqeY domain-containing protein [Odoribacter sp.]